MIRSAITCLFVVLLVVPAGESCAQSRVGTTASTFLTLGTGARGSAVGHANTALATGAEALFWNPGGAARAYAGDYKGNVFFSHYEWFAEIGYNAAGLTLPVTSSGVLGVSVAAVDYGQMDVTTANLPDGNGATFEPIDFSFGLSYAQPLTDRFYLGGTVKYVRQSIYDMTAQTMAADIGFVLQTRYFNGARIAASIMNFGGKMQMEGVNARATVDIDEDNNNNNPDTPARLKTNAWDLPLSFRLGTAVPVVRAGNAELLLLADAQQTNDNNLNGDFGAQASYLVGPLQIALRGGYKDLQGGDNSDAHWTLGGGLDLEVAQFRAGFDYATVFFETLGPTQLVDFQVYF